MLHSLLVYSLERISSLQHFYEIESENIDKVATEGMKVNCFGYLADRYFSMLTYVDETDEEVEKLKKRIENYVEVVEANKDVGSVIYKLKRADYLKEQGYEMDVKKASLRYRQFADMPIIHGSNTLIMLITRFEEFISNFLGELYIMFPQKYLDNQSVTFSELSSANINDVKQLIVNRQLDAIMRESFKEWFKIFSSHKLSFEHYVDEMKTLEEIYARRNVFVHNSGRVNEYLKSIFDVIFESLCTEKHRLCVKVYSALLNNKNLDALHRTMSTINYWISSIELNGLNSVKKQIEDYDVSALAPMFGLAKYLLLEDYDYATTLLEELYDKEDVTVHMIENWPLFKGFRNTTQYETFKMTHAEDFKVATFEFASENQTVMEDDPDLSEETVSQCDCLSEEQPMEEEAKEPLLV